MIGNFSLLSAVLTGVSVVSLSLLSLLCLRCRRKSKINEVEHQIYNPQTFHRGGSRFAVTQSKTVTRSNQMTSHTIETPEEFHSASFDHQSSYENIRKSTESLDHTYVDPIPGLGYEIEQNKSGRAADNEDQGIYINMPEKENDDDYENSEFLEQAVEDDEPDYVNSPDQEKN